MTIGDVIERARGLLGGESVRIRRLRDRVGDIVGKIRIMEDGLLGVRKKVSAIEERIEDLKRELRVEASVHNQDMIMDEIDSLDREFGRLRELADLKRVNVDAARTLRSKLEQLLETALNGGSTAELEDVLLKVECMDDEMSDVRDLIRQLDGPKKASHAEMSTAESGTEDAERAARRARILGEKTPVPSKEASVGGVADESPAGVPATAVPPVSPESSSTGSEIAVAR